MSISDFEQSLWELALLINPTHLANITTSKLNSYYQDTILDMRKVVLVQNLFNDIYNNWTDHQIRYQQNRRRQIENGEITEQQLMEEESEENESEIEYISDEEGQEMEEEAYDSVDYAKQNENKENVDSSNVIIGNDNTVITVPVRKSSVTHKTTSKPLKKVSENQSTDNKKNESVVLSTPNSKTNKDMATEKNTTAKAETKPASILSKDTKKKSSKTDLKDKKDKENVKSITLDFSSKDTKSEEISSGESSPEARDTKTKKSKKEHRRKKIEREPRKDSLKATSKLTDDKSNEVLKELQKSGVIHSDNNNNNNNNNNINNNNNNNNNTDELQQKKSFVKSPDPNVSLDEKTETSIGSISSSSNASNNNSFVIRSFNIPSQQNSQPTTNTTSTASSIATSVISKSYDKPLPPVQDPVPVRKSSNSPSYKKNKVTYRLSDKNVSIKNKYKLSKNDSKEKEKESQKVEKAKLADDETVVHLRPKKITNETDMPPTMQRRSMDELLFQFADVMDIVSLIPHIVGDDDLLGNDLTFNSSNLNSKVQTKDSNGNVIEETPRRRPSRAPTPPPTVVSNGKEYEVYSIPSERHQKYIRKKEEMEKQNKRRSSLKFEYHGFEDLKRQQELAGYDTTGDIPITERKAREKELAKNTNNTTSNNSNSNSKSGYTRNNSSSGSCGASMKMDVLSGCMSSSSTSNSSHSSSKNSSGNKASRFLNSLTKSKSKSGSKEKEKEKMSSSNSSANKENINSNTTSSSKNYLVRRKSTDKNPNSSSSTTVRSYQRYKLGSSSQDSSSVQSSPTLSSVSNSSSGSRSSSAKKSYSSTTLSKYDLPHMSSLSSESSSRRYNNGERGSSKATLTTSKSSPGIYENLNLPTHSSSTSSSSSKHHRPKKATDHKSSSTSEIDKFFDNVFRIDWSL